MFKQTAAYSLLILALSMQVSGHALIEPALGIPVGGTRNDVTRPSNDEPCGRGVNVEAELLNSNKVQANPDGSFVVNISNFNKNVDGSRKIVESKVDTSGTGNSFSDDVQPVQNGDRSSKTLSTQTLIMQMPAGSTCTGGEDGKTCIVSFKTAGGFGNCVAVTQAGSDAGAAAADPAAAAGTATTPPAAGGSVIPATPTDVAAAASASDAADASGDDSSATPDLSSLLANLGGGADANNADATSDDDSKGGLSGLLGNLLGNKRAIGTRVARPMRAVVEARKVADGSLL